MKKTVVSINLAASLFFILACSLQDSGNNTSKGTGTIVMHAQWPDEMKRIKAPINVVKVKVIISGADMSDIQKTFDAADGKATIRRVPAGTKRTVTLQGLDSGGIAIYEGSKPNITISAGGTTDCGTIVMNPVGAIPSEPENIIATAGNAQVTISWDAVSGAESYKIYMSTATGVSKENYEATVNTIDVSYLWTNLTNATAYYFVVTAKNIYGEGAESTEIMSQLGSIPSPPEDVNATAGDGQVTISWKAVSGAESYNIYMSTASGVSKENYEATVNTIDVSYLWTNLTNGTTYYFVVTAENIIYGESTESTEVSAIPRVTWAKTYGGTGKDFANSIQQTADGGYIVAGYTTSFGAGDNDIWVLKLNANGTVAWQKTFGGTGYDVAKSIQQTADGGYIVAGYTASFGAGDDDIWVLKLNADGAVAWQKTFGGTGYDAANSIQQTGDGGYIVTGNTRSFGAGIMDIWVLKLNINGTVAWQKTYGGLGWDSARSIHQTTDQGYIVTGDTGSFGAGSSDIWILKLNADGTVAWQKTFGGTEGDGAQSIQQTADGGYIVTGSTISFGAGSSETWVLKLNADGTVAWQKTFGGTEGDDAQSIQQTADGGYIVAVGTNSFGASGMDIWILKLNADGTVAWQKTYGGQDMDYPWSTIHQTTDQGYIVTGYTWSFGAGQQDIWVLKLAKDGYLGCGFGVDSSALISDPGVSGSNTNATVTNTSATVLSSNTSGQNSTAVVEIQCMVGDVLIP